MEDRNLALRSLLVSVSCVRFIALQSGYGRDRI